MAAKKFQSIDFRPFMEGPGPGDPDYPNAAQHMVAKEIDAAFRTCGFFFLYNFGLSADLLEDMFDVTKQMFDRPREEKEAELAPITRPKHIGYTPFSKEILNSSRGPDMKEVCIVLFYFKKNPPLELNQFV